jgi:hypothetical protein
VSKCWRSTLLTLQFVMYLCCCHVSNTYHPPGTKAADGQTCNVGMLDGTRPEGLFGEPKP